MLEEPARSKEVLKREEEGGKLLRTVSDVGHPKNTWIIHCRNSALQCIAMQARCTASLLVQAHFTPTHTLFK